MFETNNANSSRLLDLDLRRASLFKQRGCSFAFVNRLSLSLLLSPSLLTVLISVRSGNFDLAWAPAKRWHDRGRVPPSTDRRLVTFRSVEPRDPRVLTHPSGLWEQVDEARFAVRRRPAPRRLRSRIVPRVNCGEDTRSLPSHEIPPRDRSRERANPEPRAIPWLRRY